MKNISDETLMAYMDGLLSEIDRSKVREALTDSPVLQQRLEEFQQVESWMQHLDEPQVSSNFTHNVMDHLNKIPESATRKTFQWNGLWVIFLSLSTAFVYLFQVSGHSGRNSTWTDSFRSYWPEYFGKLAHSALQLPYHGFASKGFVLLYAILILVMFDRLLLRPYFQERRRKAVEASP